MGRLMAFKSLFRHEPPLRTHGWSDCTTENFLFFYLTQFPLFEQGFFAKDAARICYRGLGGVSSALSDLPQSNLTLNAAAGEQAPTRAPGQREDLTGMGQCLHLGATLEVPEPDGGIIAPGGQQAAIGSKSQALDALGMPARPAQRGTFEVPQLERVVPAPGGEQA